MLPLGRGKVTDIPRIPGNARGHSLAFGRRRQRISSATVESRRAAATACRPAAPELVALPSSRRTSIAVRAFRSLSPFMLEPAASQPGDQHQDIGEHLPWHRDLGHLEREIAAVAGDLGADLDERLRRATSTPGCSKLWPEVLEKNILAYIPMGRAWPACASALAWAWRWGSNAESA